jgi:hypothetical protein
MQYKRLIRKISVNNPNHLREVITKYNDREINDTNINENLCIQNIKFNEQKKIDFFTIQPVYGGTGFFISEKLKEQFEKENCSGMVFTEPNERYP